MQLHGNTHSREYDVEQFGIGQCHRHCELDPCSDECWSPLPCVEMLDGNVAVRSSAIVKSR